MDEREQQEVLERSISVIRTEEFLPDDTKFDSSFVDHWADVVGRAFVGINRNPNLLNEPKALVSTVGNLLFHACHIHAELEGAAVTEGAQSVMKRYRKSAQDPFLNLV